MKYNFYEFEIEKKPFYEKDIIQGKKYYIPALSFKVLDEEYKILDGLGRLSGEYVREIVKSMEEVRDGRLDCYDFGPMDSVIIDVFGDNFKNEKYRGKTIISHDNQDIFMEIPFEEIYNLMKDYLTEIDKWEKKTGREKPGW